MLYKCFTPTPANCVFLWRLTGFLNTVVFHVALADHGYDFTKLRFPRLVCSVVCFGPKQTVPWNQSLILSPGSVLGSFSRVSPWFCLLWGWSPWSVLGSLCCGGRVGGGGGESMVNPWFCLLLLWGWSPQSVLCYSGLCLMSVSLVSPMFIFP